MKPLVFLGLLVLVVSGCSSRLEEDQLLGRWTVIGKVENSFPVKEKVVPLSPPDLGLRQYVFTPDGNFSTFFDTDAYKSRGGWQLGEQGGKQLLLINYTGDSIIHFVEVLAAQNDSAILVWQRSEGAYTEHELWVKQPVAPR